MEYRNIEDPLPDDVNVPLRFRERGRDFEGQVAHPKEIVAMFEPIDVLNGATELVDQNGVVLTIETTDSTALDENEYPRDRRGLIYRVRRPD